MISIICKNNSEPVNEFFSIKDNKLIGVIFLFLLNSIFSFQINAQVFITYSNSSSNALINEDVIACDGQALNQARFLVTSDNANNMTVTLEFPDGITYHPNSIITVNQIGGLSISEQDISDLNHPIFSISPANLSIGNEITIQWSREANTSCETYDIVINGGILKDNIFISTDGGNVDDTDLSENSYDLLYASLSINGQGPIVTNVGNSVDRTLTITNGGQGNLDDFTFYIKDGQGTVTTQLVTSAGTIILPTTISNDTLFYNITGLHFNEIGNNDNKFDNGEQITLKRTYNVISCDNDSYYQAYWGCPGQCQSTTILQQQTSIYNAVPNLSVTMPTVNKDYCFNGTNSKIGGIPVIQTIKVTNNGNGPATNFELIMYNFHPGSNTGWNYYSDDLWTIEDSSGNPIGIMDNFTNLHSRSFLQDDCTSSSQACHVKQSATGIIIAPGESIYIKIPTYVQNFECNNNCNNANLVWYSFSGEWTYKDQCESNSYNQTITNFRARPHNFAEYLVEMPTDLIDQQEFNILFDYNRLYTTIKSNTEGYNYLEVDYSATDLIYNGGPLIDSPWGDLQTTVNGNILSIRIPDNMGGTSGLIYIPMKAVCGTSGEQTVSFAQKVKYDEACDGDGYYNECQESTFQMHCGTCIDGGATPKFFTLERINYGQPDNDDNHEADSSGSIDLSKINVHRAVDGDTILGSWYIEVIENGTVGDPNIGVDFNHVYVEFDLHNNPYAGCNNTSHPVESTVFTALPQTEVTIFPSGGGASFTCYVDPIIDGVIAKYDLSSCKATWAGGDSIIVKAKYISNASITQSGFIKYIAANEVYSSYIPNPVGDNPSPMNKYTCDHFNDFLNILNIHHSPWMPSPQNISGCSNSFQVNMRQYTKVQAGPVWFPYEFRNFAIFDEFKVVWPPELVFRPGSAQFNGIPIPDANVSQVNDTLTFSNLKDFYTPYGGTLKPRDEIEGKQITWSIDPSCDAEPGAIYHAKFKGTTIGNGLNTPSSDWESYHSCYYTYSQNISMLYNAPLPFFTGGGTEQMSKNTVDWNVFLNNGSNNIGASNSWIYLQNNDGTLGSFIVKQGGTEIIPDANGFYHLGENAPSASTPYTITATSIICDTARLNVITGYHCSSYPSSLDDYPCSDTLFLLATPLPSEVQIQILEEPPVPISLCTDVSYKIQLTSAQAADLDNPVLAIKLPEGLNVVAPVITIEYPAGSGDIQNALTTQSNDTIFVNLESHSAIGVGGLPGTINALTPEEREAIININFSTDCSFISGNYIAFVGKGDRPCGDKANNDGVAALSSGLYVTGAEQPYAAGVTIQPSHSPIDCSPITLSVDIGLAALIDNTTSLDDSIYFNIPAGLEYIPNSYSCTSVDCPILIDQRPGPLGSIDLVFLLSDPVIDLVGGGHISFAIDIQDNQYASCNSDKSLRLDIIRALSSVACTTEATGLCPSFRVLMGTGTTTVSIQKSVISFQSFLTSCNGAAEMDYSGEIQIDSVGLQAGESLIIDIFCADNLGNPDSYIQSETINGPIVAGSIIQFSGTTPAEICNPDYGLIAQVSTINNNSDYQCICSDVSGSSGQIPDCPSCNISSIESTTCSDNETADTTDDYFTIEITATNELIGATNKYEIIYNGTVLNPGGTTYGTSFTIGANKEFNADGSSTYMILIRDIDKPNTCSINKQFGPVDFCSTCDITSSETIFCNYNSTHTDTSDDYFTVEILSTNINPGTSNQYEIIYNGIVLNPPGTTYGTTTNIGTNQEFNSDGNTLYTITVRDKTDTTCYLNIDLPNPGPCSSCPTLCLPITIIK